MVENSKKGNEMKIVTDGKDWVVKAEWLGAERVVHRGDIFSCISFKVDNE